MREIINRKPATWILSAIILMVVGIAYIVDDLCYRNEQELTLRLAGSSMFYAEELIKNKGDITRKNQQLFAGDLLLNEDSTIVDMVKSKTKFGCTIFLDSIRISTTAQEKGSPSRAIGTYANAQIIENVLIKGNSFQGITNTIGKDWVIIYVPLKDVNKLTVGMLATFIDLEEFVGSRFHFRLFSSLILLFLISLIFLYSLWNKYLIRKFENIALDKIQVRNEELESVNSALDSFVYRASHDLKLPIVNMQSMLRMLPSVISLDKDSTGEKVVANLNRSADDLQKIINDLLQISKVDSKPELAEEIDLKKLIEDIILSMDQLIEDNNGEVVFDISQNPKITAPPIALKSILTNLINNAFKYKSSDRGSVVTISSFIQNNESCISISDNGLGMDLNKYGNKLFQMFSRHHTHLNIPGTGVGLHIVKKLLDYMEAKIEVESILNIGTKFIIRLKN